ncbi:MAG: helix-turn-helix transcriptional regulator [Saprospiraceae bacterium]|nr:helix-turn-helix transcriptional regulator [Saprospiraceae bacterium]MBK7738250.1 helix-turn-helix transcriptional regulator [Saprospiraceae bacterium]MBK7913176.1 helix-turn-helix transcriptional regulator [Saprospiraceae bacterium]
MLKSLFHIFKLNREDALKIIAAPDPPHAHDYEELILGMTGKLEHFIDFKTETYEAPFASFVSKGKTHRVIPHLQNDQCEVWVIRFQSEFIPETTFQLYSYYHDHATIKMQAGRCFNRLLSLCELMHAEMQYSTPDLAVVRHLLSALFTMIESERKKISEDAGSYAKTQNTTFKNFLKILEENYLRPEGVEFYAEKLFMSSRNLNLICQNILQKSVSEIIETRKLIEAKNQLINTDKTVAEIAFDLGYNEHAYFTNVFKRKSGQTPTEFRQEIRQLVS